MAVLNTDRMDAARSKTDTEHEEGIVPEKAETDLWGRGIPMWIPHIFPGGKTEDIPGTSRRGCKLYNIDPECYWYFHEFMAIQ